jgi:hypothetical protein
MGSDAIAALLAAIIAVVVTALEMITTKYPRTSVFCFRSAWFYAYIIVYGAIAAVAYLLPPLVGAQVNMTGVGLANPWVQAAAAGFSVKALLHIRILNVSTGPGKDFPVGLETIVLLFEPWLLRSIELDVFGELMGFVTPRAARCATINIAQQQALSNIPNMFSAAEKAALTADVTRATSPVDVIIAYLGYVGLKLTRRVFP